MATKTLHPAITNAVKLLETLPSTAPSVERSTFAHELALSELKGIEYNSELVFSVANGGQALAEASENINEGNLFEVIKDMLVSTESATSLRQLINELAKLAGSTFDAAEASHG